MRKVNLWRGITSIIAFLLIFSIFGTSIALQYATSINTFLGISTTQMIEDDSGEGEDTQYYPSEYGELSKENLQLLIQDAYGQAVAEMEEGAVLLRNENNALPLAENERKVTLFGHAVVQPLYRTNASGSNAAKTGTYVIDLYQALQNNGFSINDELYKAYQNSATTRTPEYGGWDESKDAIESLGEENLSFYTEALQNSWSASYQDAAIVMFAREGGEDVDMKLANSDGISSLALQKDEEDLLAMIRDSGKFAKIIVLINSPYQMELGWLEDYGVDACLWIGTPGQRGFEGVANILTGDVNPSGRLVDTYATDSLSAPAVANSSQNTPTWANLDELLSAGIVTDDPSEVSYVNVQVEGIYVGYKYYETRYEDALLHPDSGADSGVGATGAETWLYQNEVTYPFGYGLSYTTFEQSLENVAYDAAGETYTAHIKVTNMGDTAGKSVVQLYAQTPYGEYEKTNRVEKSSIQLVGFSKTGLLQPGASESVTIEVDPYLLASYDYVQAKGYILSAGDYYLAVGDDAHDALNNVLAAKGVSGMVTPFGEVVSGDAQKTYKWTQAALDTETYKYSETGAMVTNQFADSDINHWHEDAVTYLTRQNWAETFPVAPVQVVCTEEMMYILQGDTYTKPEDSPSVDDITQGASNGMTLVMMKDVPYDDTVAWDTYLDQMTVEEMSSELVDLFGTKEVLSVGKPNVLTSDGCDSLRGTYQGKYGDNRDTCLYPSVIVLTATWNPDILRRRGELMAEEAFYVGTPEIWTGGGNLHRTPFNGRNGEYYSEDSFMNYLAAKIELGAMLERGTQPCIKHFAGNDQEMYRCGLVMFFNEQGFREGALRGFESTLRASKVGSNATMQSFNRLGLVWASSSPELNNNVLRSEWGFAGHTITDAIVGKTYAYHFTTSLTAGTDNYCIDMEKASAAAISEAIASNDDGNLLRRLREAVKNYHYALSRSNLVNGMSSNFTMVSVTPWWVNALYAAVGVLALLTALSFTIMVIAKVKRKKAMNSLHAHIEHEKGDHHAE